MKSLSKVLKSQHTVNGWQKDYLRKLCQEAYNLGCTSTQMEGPEHFDDWFEQATTKDEIH